MKEKGFSSLKKKYLRVNLKMETLHLETSLIENLKERSTMEKSQNIIKELEMAC